MLGLELGLVLRLELALRLGKHNPTLLDSLGFDTLRGTQCNNHSHTGHQKNTVHYILSTLGSELELELALRLE